MKTIILSSKKPKPSQVKNNSGLVDMTKKSCDLNEYLIPFNENNVLTEPSWTPETIVFAL